MLPCLVVRCGGTVCYRESIAVLRNEPFGSLIIGSCKGFVSGSFLHSLLMDKVLHWLENHQPHLQNICCPSRNVLTQEQGDPVLLQATCFSDPLPQGVNGVKQKRSARTDLRPRFATRWTASSAWWTLRAAQARAMRAFGSGTFCMASGQT